MKHLQWFISLLAIIAIVRSQATTTTSLPILQGGYTNNMDRFAQDPYITAATASTLKTKWALTIEGDVTATPAIFTIQGVLTAFFPDW